MTDTPDHALSRFTALLNELVGAAMVLGMEPKNTAAIEEIARLKAELKGMFEEARKGKWPSN